MVMGPWFIVSSEGLEKPAIELAVPILQEEKLNYYTTEVSSHLSLAEILHLVILEYSIDGNKQSI